ncbi:MAG: glycine betaine ABC transporter substrate-binding protein [Candidatus Kapaibacterium sp.]
MRRFTILRLTAILLLPVMMLSCAKRGSIVVGAKAFTEGYLLGHMAVLALRDAGFDVEEQFGLATTAMRSALETGQVDLYYEYTGTAYTVYAKGKDAKVMADSALVYNAVRAFDSTEHGLIWLTPIPFDDTYALMMKHDRADREGIHTISDLAGAITNGSNLRIAVDGEFYERPDGLKALVRHYGFPEKNIVKLDAGLIYKALTDGSIDVGMGYSTDGQIQAFNLSQLRDDRAFFPAYNPAAVVRKELLLEQPRVRAVLERLNGYITPAVIRKLNAEVSMEHHDPRKVAERWLRSLPPP